MACRAFFSFGVSLPFFSDKESCKPWQKHPGNRLTKQAGTASDCQIPKQCKVYFPNGNRPTSAGDGGDGGGGGGGGNGGAFFFLLYRKAAANLNVVGNSCCLRALPCALPCALLRQNAVSVEKGRSKSLASKLFLLYYNITTACKNKFLYCVRNRFFAERKEQPFVEIWREKVLASKLFLLYYSTSVFRLSTGAHPLHPRGCFLPPVLYCWQKPLSYNARCFTGLFGCSIQIPMHTPFFREFFVPFKAIFPSYPLLFLGFPVFPRPPLTTALKSILWPLPPRRPEILFSPFPREESPRKAQMPVKADEKANKKSFEVLWENASPLAFFLSHPLPARRDIRLVCFFFLFCMPEPFPLLESRSGACRVVRRNALAITRFVLAKKQKKKAPIGTPLCWSERQDSNLRPLGPEPSALPSCATPRRNIRNRREPPPLRE